MTKNEQIKQTLKETRERRKTQTIKVFELKVNCHHTSKNVKLFGSTKRAECLEQASAEASITTQSIASQSVMQIEPLKRRQEATTL